MSMLEPVIEHLEKQYDKWRRALNPHHNWLEFYGDNGSDTVEIVKKQIEELENEAEFYFGCKLATEILSKQVEDNNERKKTE